MFVSYFSLITFLSHDASIWQHVSLSLQQSTFPQYVSKHGDELCLNHNKGGLFPDCRWSQPLPLPSPPAWPETVSDPVQCRPSELFTAFSVAVSRRCLHAFFLHQSKAATPNVWFRLISHFFLHNYFTGRSPWFRIKANFWQLIPEFAPEIMQCIDWLTRKWWSWMQFWQNSYFDATAWYWEADIELSAQKPFWSVS